jgi:hypothetical protein
VVHLFPLVGGGLETLKREPAGLEAGAVGGANLGDSTLAPTGGVEPAGTVAHDDDGEQPASESVHGKVFNGFVHGFIFYIGQDA